jgi:Ribonuclease G/E
VRVLRDMVSDTTEHVIVDSTENYSRMVEFAEQYVQSAVRKIERYSASGRCSSCFPSRRKSTRHCRGG